MKINNLSFITPIKDPENIILEKNYSKKFNLSNGSNINVASNIGKREEQQDSIVVSKNNEYILLLVADGMGGLKQGEVASYNTAKTIKEWFESEDKDNLPTLDEIILEKILTLLMYLISDRMPYYAGTTLNMSIICPEITIIANVGDSRAYTIKDGEITLRTKDDSQAFDKFKPVTENQRDQLRFYRQNNIVTNAIMKNIMPNITVTTIKNEDYDILCHITDGISDILTENIIRICCHDEEPAESLVYETNAIEYLHNPINSENFFEYIYPTDNTSAVVYTKKKVKNS